jgi:hypothetical protein
MAPARTAYHDVKMTAFSVTAVKPVTRGLRNVLPQGIHAVQIPNVMRLEVVIVVAMKIAHVKNPRTALPVVATALAVLKLVVIVLPASKELVMASAIQKKMEKTVQTVRQASVAVTACARVEKIV